MKIMTVGALVLRGDVGDSTSTRESMMAQLTEQLERLRPSQAFARVTYRAERWFVRACHNLDIQVTIIETPKDIITLSDAMIFISIKQHGHANTYVRRAMELDCEIIWINY